MEPQDYDCEDGCCPECLDECMVCEPVWDTPAMELLKYTCPGCGYVALLYIPAPDPNEMIIPPYDS